MSNKSRRVHISITPGQYERWKEFAESHYDGNINQMVRDSVRRIREKLEGEGKSDLDPVLNSLEGLYSNILRNQDILQTLRIRLNAEDDDSESYEVAKRILDLLWEEGYTPSQVLGELDCEQETVDGALAILEKLGLINFEQNSGDVEKVSEGGEEYN